jgi:hypothetical protein
MSPKHQTNVAAIVCRGDLVDPFQETGYQGQSWDSIVSSVSTVSAESALHERERPLRHLAAKRLARSSFSCAILCLRMKRSAGASGM